MALICDMEDNELIGSYDYHKGLMFRSIQEEIRLGQIESELTRRGITYDFDEALLDFMKGLNNE